MFDDDDQEPQGRSSGPPPPERPMTLPVAAMWAFFATSLLIVLLYATHAMRPSASTDLVNGLGCTAVAYLLSIFLIARTHAGQHGLGDFLGLRPTHPAMYAVSAALGVALQVPAEMFRRVIERRWPTPPDVVVEQLATFRLDSGARRILIPIVVVCLGPMIEELLFRGALQRGLRRNYGSVTAVLSVAALFALGHVDPRAIAPIFVVGLFLGTIRAASGSLLPSLVAHMCFNSVVVVGLLTGKVSMDPQTDPLPPSVQFVGLVGTALLTALILLLARFSTRAQRARQEDLA